MAQSGSFGVMAIIVAIITVAVGSAVGSANAQTTTGPLPQIYERSIDTDYLWQFLYNYDIIGFIIACWTIDLGESFYVIISMIVTLSFYIKLKNLTVMAVMWFLLGFLWIWFIPVASPIIFLLFIFGLASLVFKIFGESKY